MFTEIMLNILYPLLYFSDLLLWYMMLDMVLFQKTEHQKRMKKILVSILFSIIIASFKENTSGFVRIMMIFIFQYPMYIILSQTFYKTTIKKSLVCIIVFWGITVLIEAVIVLAYNVISKYYMIEISTSGFYNVVLSFITKIFDFLILKYVQVKLKRNKGIFDIKNIIYITCPCIVFLTITTTLMAQTNFGKKFFAYAGVASIVIVSVTLTFIKLNIYQKKQEKKYSEKLSYITTQLTMTESYKKTLGEIRQLRHDMKNHLCALAILVEKNENERALKYIQDLIPVSQNDGICNLESTMLAIILYEKKLQAEQKEIGLELQILVNDLLIPAKDVNTIIGNMMDNAIEACEKIEQKEERKIKFSIFTDQENTTIECINTYAEKPVWGDNGLQSSKLDKLNHGYGINSIYKTVEKNNGTVKIRFGKNKFIITAIFDINVSVLSG